MKSTEKIIKKFDNKRQQDHNIKKNNIYLINHFPMPPNKIVYPNGDKETELFDAKFDLNSVMVQNCEVEGEQKIRTIEAYQLSTGKVIMTIILSIFTALIYLLFLRNSLRFRLKSLYNKSLVYCATHFLITNDDGKQEIIKKVKSQELNKIQFINRHMKYQYYEDEKRKAFFPVYYHQVEKQSLKDIKKLHEQGLTNEKVIQHTNKYGLCEIEIPVPTLLEYLAEILTEIFFIFQYLTMLLWILEGFAIFAIIMICASVIITLINYYLLRLSLNKLKQFAKFNLKVEVIRNRQKQYIDCLNLLPGDVFFYQNNMQLPCDSLLISGDVLVNESSLTGESIPVPKISIDQNDNQSQHFNIETMKNHVLYEGTKIIQIKGEQVYGIVLRSGYTSFRGGIFRAMLYPREIKFTFYRNGIYFLLTLIAIGIIAYLGMLYNVLEREVPTILVIYRFFDTATWMIPPALPIFFSVCQTISLLRLRRKKILATDPAKVVVAGDVSIMCFDKTGTLTKDAMEIYGYSDHKCQQIKHSLEEQSEKEKLLHKFFGSCHGVYNINGQNLGDELDIKMIEFSKYEIIDGQSANYKFRVKKQDTNSFLSVFKVWEFESSLQRMSVIVQDEQDQKIYGIVKGSPEKIHELCRKDSIDQNAFKRLLNELTNKGLRVIAFGYKQLQNKDLSREDLERDIEFLGLFVLENKLKTDTADVIKRLQNGNIHCKVISGDNLLTTVQCAKEANIISNDAHKVLICDSMNDCYIQATNEKKDISKVLSTSESKLFQIGITGKFLEEFQNQFNRNYGQQEKQMLLNLLHHTIVFSRCKPKQKAEIILLLQLHLNEKIGMIGDGANDCSAIKQADIGISFTKTDASYSSPFSYSESSLDCIIKVLCEGRCTLSNMIECFRFYLTVSVIKFIIACALILEYSHFSTFQIVYINYFVSIPFLLLIAMSRPLDDLTPYRSISNMLDIENFFSVYGQIILTIFQVLTHYFHLREQIWFEPTLQVEEENTYYQKSMSGTVLFLVCVMSFVFSLLAYYISYPSKKKIYQNMGLSIAMLIIFIYTILLYTIPESVGFSVLGLHKTITQKSGFLGVQLIIALCFGFLIVIYEEMIVKRYLGPHRKNLNVIKKTGSIVY